VRTQVFPLCLLISPLTTVNISTKGKNEGKHFLAEMKLFAFQFLSGGVFTFRGILLELLPGTFPPHSLHLFRGSLLLSAKKNQMLVGGVVRRDQQSFKFQCVLLHFNTTLPD
jgi:hypothetical protein